MRRMTFISACMLLSLLGLDSAAVGSYGRAQGVVGPTVPQPKFVENTEASGELGLPDRWLRGPRHASKHYSKKRPYFRPRHYQPWLAALRRSMEQERKMPVVERTTSDLDANFRE